MPYTWYAGAFHTSIAPRLGGSYANLFPGNVAHTRAAETVLLQKINRGLSPSTDRRYRELVAKRRAETLSSEEHTELLEMTDEVEEWQAERVRLLIELAAIRGRSLSELMVDLGIEALPVE